MSNLRIQAINVNFGALNVLNDLSIVVKEGTLHSIVGPNGAGKTTLFNVISGFIRPTSGTVFFNGTDLTKLPAHKRVQLGISRSFQVITIFPELTVLENVRLGLQSKSKKKFRFLKNADKLDGIIEQAYKLLERVQLVDKANKNAGELSHGEQRYLDIGVAIACADELVLLDEPTSGLVHDEIPRMGEFIKSLTPELTVILIEHRIDMVLSISNTVTVLDYGRLIVSGLPEIVKENKEARIAYIGEMQ